MLKQKCYENINSKTAFGIMVYMKYFFTALPFSFTLSYVFSSAPK